MDKDQLELFNAWFYRAKHRAKYTDDHPAYLAAQEAWEAAHEACAKVGEEYSAVGKIEEFDRGWMACAKAMTTAIRARGKA